MTGPGVIASEVRVPVLPGAEPFAADPPASREVGVVLCHGFTGTPQSMRAWGRELLAAGIGVRGPRLPGHGTRWQDLNATRWSDWYGEVARAVDDVASRYRTVLVFGMSMGGTLTLRLAQEYGPAIDGIALVNPSVTTLRRDAPFARYLQWVLPSVGAVAGDIRRPGVTEIAYDRTPVRAAVSLAELWALVRADLDRVRCPVLLFRSPADHVVEPISSRLVLDGVASDDVTDVVLHDSYHVATLDHDAPRIVSDSIAFARRLAAGPDRPRPAPSPSTVSGTSAGKPV